MNIDVRIEPTDSAPSGVEYRWDADTDILTANVRPHAVAEGPTATVEIEGSDGSWLILDLRAGSINGVEVAVWPDVHKRATLTPPSPISNARVIVVPKNGKGGDGVSALEMDTAMAAEADEAERTIHFRLGGARQTRAVRIARDILIDIDARDRLAGVWLLDVPPFPAEP